MVPLISWYTKSSFTSDLNFLRVQITPMYVRFAGPTKCTTNTSINMRVKVLECCMLQGNTGIRCGKTTNETAYVQLRIHARDLFPTFRPFFDIVGVALLYCISLLHGRVTCKLTGHVPQSNMNSHYTYFLILGASLAGPLALSFDKKVAFYKSWKYVVPAMILPAIFYIAWDVFFTAKQVWSFNDNYITGIHLFNLPIEEVLFFLVVPYCCLFIYACIRAYFPQLNSNGTTRRTWWVLGILLVVAALVF